MTTDTIRELTQSLIALAVIIGGGYIMFVQPASPAVPFITGIIGGIISWYFSRAQAQTVATHAANLAADAVKADR